MNSVVSRLALLGFLLSLVFAPFAGFAPLLLIMLVAGIYWSVGSIARILVFGEEPLLEQDTSKK